MKKAQLTDDFVHRVVVVKCDKTKSTPFARFSFCDNFHRLDASKAWEVFLKVIFIRILTNPANKHLLHWRMDVWKIRLLTGEFMKL